MRLYHKPNSSPDFRTDCDLPEGQAPELTIDCLFSTILSLLCPSSEASLRNSLGLWLHQILLLKTAFFPISLLPA